MTVAHLKRQDKDEVKQPSFLVLCSPSGLPVDSLMQQLAAQLPNSIARIVTHTSRMPMVGFLSIFVPCFAG